MRSHELLMYNLLIWEMCWVFSDKILWNFWSRYPGVAVESSQFQIPHTKTNLSFGINLYLGIGFIEDGLD